MKKTKKKKEGLFEKLAKGKPISITYWIPGFGDISIWLGKGRRLN